MCTYKYAHITDGGLIHTHSFPHGRSPHAQEQNMAGWGWGVRRGTRTTPPRRSPECTVSIYAKPIAAP